VNILLALAAGYLIGGIPTGILISRAVAGIDPRETGSHSSGATNVSRVIGKKWAALVLILDGLKGFVPVAVLSRLSGGSGAELATLTGLGLGAVAGHIWTPYARFRGGKGVATAAGVLVYLEPRAIGLAIIVWIVLFVAFRIVSLASLCAAVSVPIVMLWPLDSARPLVVSGSGIAVLLLFSHRDNVRRLVAGRETRMR
jgi:glycerol-3-phosphate acyltransferase PlsY